MKVTQVRNATLIVDYNDTRFLIDPWLGPKDYMPGFETAIHSEIRQPRVDLPFDTEKIVNVHAVIVTHVHPDHWNIFRLFHPLHIRRARSPATASPSAATA